MEQNKQTFKKRLHEIVFEADTPMGKAFDVSLLVLILLSVLLVMLESVESIGKNFPNTFYYLEWGITILFTLEYLLRIWLTGKPMKYILSFYGIVDLLSIIPTYLGIFFTGTSYQYLTTIRALRLLRIFRVFKAVKYLSEASILYNAILASTRKITVFLVGVLTLVLIIGSAMYLIEEGEGSGFDSIPHSVYWAIVTVTTVGYGDIAPVTPLGQFLSAILMILGYGVLAVPTGIVSAELSRAEPIKEEAFTTRACPNCSMEGHDADAVHCKFCGAEL
ncbi:MAG: ion transporter [Bacteroidota bacterium]